jgi:hypothetical protein
MVTDIVMDLCIDIDNLDCHGDNLFGRRVEIREIYNKIALLSCVVFTFFNKIIKMTSTISNSSVLCG